MNDKSKAPPPMQAFAPIQSQDEEARSADLVAANIDQLKQLFPEAFTEDAGGSKIDFEVLKQLLGGQVSEREERYGLNWHGKRRARQLALTPSTGTLLPCPEESVDWDTTQNLMIEGDNLEVLKLLQKSYAGKVKLIYIDPPYNTGNDFVYPDNFADSIKNYLEITGQVEGGHRVSSNTEASGRFHTDWLNMMYPRLKLARNLLRSDGLIFVSVGEEEIANLLHVMGEIFGEESFIACLVWQKKTGAGAKSKGFIGLHEYIVCYANEVGPGWDIEAPLSEKTRSMYSKRDHHFDTLGPHATWPLDTTSMDDRPNLRFAIIHEGEEIWPRKQWLWSKERVEQAQREGRLVFNFNESAQKWTVRFKGYLFDDVGDEKSGKPTSIFIGPFTQEGTKDFQQYFSREVFSFPKPVALIKQLLLISVQTDLLREDFKRGWVRDEPELVLDFFAGSGTTGEAVWAVNSEVGRKTRFILVQLPEKTGLSEFPTITEITKERLRRAGKRATADSPVLTPDLGFRVFKLAPSNIRAWNPNPNDLTATLLDHTEHLVPGRSEQDVLYEVLLKLGLDLAVPIETKTIADRVVHSVGAGALMVCLADAIDRDVAEPLALGIAEWQKALSPAGGTRLVFKDSGFADDVAKTNLAAILVQSGIEPDNIRSL